MVVEKDEEFRAVVRMKDGDFVAAMRDKNAEIEHLKRAVGSTEWRELGDRFKALSAHIRVNHQHTMGDGVDVHRWRIVGLTVAESKECEALCSMAGAMLTKSPKVSLGLSDGVRRQSSDFDRWMLLLTEAGAISGITYGTEETDQGHIIHYLGTIDGFNLVSSRFCLECAAAEV